MLCPLLPGEADTPEQIDRLVRFAVECHAEEIFVEPVNPRGSGLRLCQEALSLWGYTDEAEAIQRIRNRQLTLAVQPVPQRLPIHIRHHVIEEPICLA